VLYLCIDISLTISIAAHTSSADMRVVAVESLEVAEIGVRDCIMGLQQPRCLPTMLTLSHLGPNNIN
jgi:hypothetical protein